MLAPPFVIDEGEMDEIVSRFGQAMEGTVRQLEAKRL
jgi:adenosylmethionine-8-amino-7-oxononanoate aminotransferase